ncbi:2Fe-2S iron-sulfur cluster-binding protein [Actinomycetospora sp. TBRC 11914]|uniref:xanthine dehydrogenase family Fe-S subunit n=1 Tax=Actinomycetospora sp. TBRC 11914 TaxID=2729387 RepID=UPI00145F7AA5|nr:2Fe-2S iron-sulfur cluster-binding protein [Actinomycetospora sp. TBRC 11914]NMO92662.1 2Fe-2S iron-sulfur cluster binding domain-containing protein [Actinomycetospora sp. TBRC 11914]
MTHIAADATAELTLTVNGRETTLAVAPRTTLSDVLRDRLGLTGTHVGCEHGVCGMCTVLVDGEAARACLLFAVQCEGAEITTVEGLGSAGDQHPLQRAFSHHHALQCGFCTPGMLMSSYDLLAGGTYDEATLAEDMSGVLCRCTGYRGILAAVADVAVAHPEGVPAPRAAVPAALVGRSGSASAAAPASGHDEDAAGAPAEITVPSGPPTVTVEVEEALASPVEDVWAVLADFERLAACLPGAEMTADLGGGRYRGAAKVALGPVSLAFDGLAHVVEHDPAAHVMRVLAQGADRGGSSTHAVIRLAADGREDGGTTLRAGADVHLSGRVAQFGRALAGDVSRRLFEQFAASVDEAARTGEAPAPRSGPSPVRLVLAALRARLRAVLRRRRDARTAGS